MTAKRDLGKGLTQEQVTPGHWVIESYDVYVGSSFEGTHTSRWAEIEKDGEPAERASGISEARQWIRQQIAREA